MQTLTIHYQSPITDPLKVPRPHRIRFEDGSVLGGRPEGGEIGPLSSLLGFCLTTTPDADDWYVISPSDVLIAHDDPDIGDMDLSDYYAQFIDDEGSMFGYSVPIARVEITESHGGER